MGVVERKQREKEQKIRDIIAAAEENFFLKGIHNTTMDDIAKTAEYSKGTLYLYFKNKEELASAVLINSLKIMKELLAAAFSPDKTGLENLETAAYGYYTFYKEYPDNFVFMMEKDLYFNRGEDMPYTEKCHKVAENALVTVSDILKMGIADGSIRNDINPDITSVVVWGQLHGVIDVSVRECRQGHLSMTNDIEIEEIVIAGIEMMLSSLTK